MFIISGKTAEKVDMVSSCAETLECLFGKCFRGMQFYIVKEAPRTM